MHDIGKIAVPDAVLLKPGRYEPEEYEIMKSHSAEGARVVHEILKDTDDEEFRAAFDIQRSGVRCHGTVSV